MAPKADPNPGQKRKYPANHSDRASPIKRARPGNAQRRDIQSQPAVAGLDPATGGLDVAAFVSAREFEIRALEKAMQRDRKTLSQRAFQQVPRNMRRRGASHNAKKVPKRLRKRAVKEMKEDNTPTVNSKTRPKSRLSRIRIDRARKLIGINARHRLERSKKKVEKDGAVDPDKMVDISRAPKIKKNTIADPPTATSKFKKRQVHKTWLPTHLWHAKRAHMTKPTEPLWRMAIPLEPTEKNYRPTHRAAGGRGAIAWDTSYMATIGCSGEESSLTAMLAALGLDSDLRLDSWSRIQHKWRKGSRTASNWIKDRSSNNALIAPAMVIWNSLPSSGSDELGVDTASRQRQLFIRTHPSSFLQVWNCILKIAKSQNPPIMVEDLRFEIGSIEITGPASTEALQGVLKAIPESVHAQTWESLAGLTNAASLPRNIILSFDILDPRLQESPKSNKTPSNADIDPELAELLTNWPSDKSPSVSGLFSHELRYAAGRALPSQKSINRRRTLAPPGQAPAPRPTDPKIPILLTASRSNSSDQNLQGKWTLLLPWSCVDIVWRRLLFYPLSSGSTPRFGGLKQEQQLAFEKQEPWFPGDLPGTEAGRAWSRTEEEKRKMEWEKRPKSVRVNWSSLDIGNGEKGELGQGWAYDWKYLQTLVHGDKEPLSEPSHLDPITFSSMSKLSRPSGPFEGFTLGTIRLTYLTRGTPFPPARIYRLPTVTENQELLQKWLALDPGPSLQSHGMNKLKKDRVNRYGGTRKQVTYPLENIDNFEVPGYDPSWDEEKKVKANLRSASKNDIKLTAESRALLANSLINGDEQVPDHPPCPSKECLIGFVTSGAYSLAEGRGSAIGSIWSEVVFKHWSDQDQTAAGVQQKKSGTELRTWERQRRLVVVRNSGETVGRLAIWEPI